MSVRSVCAVNWNENRAPLGHQTPTDSPRQTLAGTLAAIAGQAMTPSADQARPSTDGAGSTASDGCSSFAACSAG